MSYTRLMVRTAYSRYHRARRGAAQDLAAFLRFASRDNLAIGWFREFNASNRPRCSE